MGKNQQNPLSVVESQVFLAISSPFWKSSLEIRAVFRFY
jgi:hypothetical protein